jgi:hypothetical protein
VREIQKRGGDVICEEQQSRLPACLAKQTADLQGMVGGNAMWERQRAPPLAGGQVQCVRKKGGAKNHMCVCERERERERDAGRKRGKEIEEEDVWIHVTNTLNWKRISFARREKPLPPLPSCHTPLRRRPAPRRLHQAACHCCQQTLAVPLPLQPAAAGLPPLPPPAP